MKPTGEELYPNSYRKENVLVEWVELGEGLCGEYNENDPDDVELLRFYVQRWYEPGEGNWSSGTVTEAGFYDMDDASYCTNFPVKSTDEERKVGLQVLMSRLFDRASRDESVKKICEELSWIDTGWTLSKLGEEADGAPSTSG